MNKERLLKLAEKLDSVPPDSFGMYHWYSNGCSTSCGFKACAAGWAATIPEFAEAGFVIEYSTKGLSCGPRFNQYEGFAAVQSFFGIDSSAADYLFGSYDPNENSDEPWYVANKIREFVKNNLTYPKVEV